MASPSYNKPLGTPTKIAIHYSVNSMDSKSINNIDVNWVRNVHYNRDPNGCYGYHFVIKTDGTIQADCPINKKCWHAGPAANSGGIGICYIGGCKTAKDLKAGRGSDTRTEAQKQALVKLLCKLVIQYPTIKYIKSHTEWVPKKGGCGGFRAEKEFAWILSRNEKVKGLASGSLKIDQVATEMSAGEAAGKRAGKLPTSRNRTSSVNTGKKANQIHSTSSGGSSQSIPQETRPPYSGPNMDQYSSTDFDNPYWAEIMSGEKITNSDGNITVSNSKNNKTDNDDPSVTLEDLNITVPDIKPEPIKPQNKPTSLAYILGSALIPDGTIVNQFNSVTAIIYDAINLMLSPIEEPINHMASFINDTDTCSDEAVDSCINQAKQFITPLGENIPIISDIFAKLEDLVTILNAAAMVARLQDLNGVADKCENIADQLHTKVTNLKAAVEIKVKKINEKIQKINELIQKVSTAVTGAIITVKREIFKFIMGLIDLVRMALCWIMDRVEDVIAWIQKLMSKVEDFIQLAAGEAVLAGFRMMGVDINV